MSTNCSKTEFDSFTTGDPATTGIVKTREAYRWASLLVSFLFVAANLMAQPSRTPWEMHRGSGVQGLDAQLKEHGAVEAYVKAVIPPQVDKDAMGENRWLPAKDPEKVGFEESSFIPTNKCLEAVDYTYFQTVVTVPDTVAVTQFEIDFSGMDDGSRITIFNTKYPGGVLDPDSYVKLSKTLSANLKEYLVPGENRVVITQVDDCASYNNLKSAVVKLNGEPVQLPPPRFACTGDAYFVQDQRAQLSRVDQTESPFQFVAVGGPAASEINNLGFRITDGLLYGLELSDKGNVQVVQIHPSGNVVGLGRPPGLPSGPRFDSGDVTPDGNAMYITTNGQALYRLDLTKVPTLPAVTKVALTTSDAGAVHDWAVDPGGSALYGGDSAQGQVAKIDLTTRERRDVDVAGLPKGDAYGGAWFGANGHLFLYQNSGAIYEIDLAGPSLVGTQPGPGSIRNDAAACIVRPAQPPAAPVVCNTSWGDVHIRTPDGLLYDYQGTGDFLSLAAADGSIVVQARQEAFPGNSRVSVNTAVALNVNGDKVGFYAKPSPSLHINDSPRTDLLFGKMKLPQGGLIERSGDASRPQYVVRWPNGFVFCAVLNGSSFFDYGVSKPAGLQTTFDGFVGNLDGKAENDYHIRNGAVLPVPVNLSDLNRFGDSWRISPTESLFRSDSAPIPSAPTTSLTAADLPHLAKAQQICVAQDVTDPRLLNNCITDVGATGEKSFAESAQRVQVEQAAAPAPRDPVAGTTVQLHTYDAARDFSIARNPNGVWQYGWLPATGGTLQLYTSKLPSPTLNRWNGQPSQEFWLSVYQNPAATPTGNPSDWVVEPGAMVLHPGPQDQKSVLRFTAPAGGTYQIAVKFSLIDRQAGIAPGAVPAVDVRVVQGSATLFSDSLRSFPDSKQFLNTIELAQGSTVDVVVGFGSTNYYDDGTRVDAQITRN